MSVGRDGVSTGKYTEQLFSATDQHLHAAPAGSLQTAVKFKSLHYSAYSVSFKYQYLANRQSSNSLNELTH